jgi:CRISPR system Cascade subunit CasC
MRLIELHILQSYPVSCLNRDDVGSPKTATFGGATRSRISSQCLKRAIRFRAREFNAGLFAGQRTRKAASDLAEKLAQMGWNQKEAQDIALGTLHALTSGKAVAPGEDGQPATDTATLLYLSPAQIESVATVLQQVKTSGTAREKYASLVVKAIKGTMQDAADIAIFGRMAANEPTLTLEGAGLFAHAISTHRSENEIDFWTAVDDYKEMRGETGAANMGSAEFVSATYYRYAALNLDLLKDKDHLAALPAVEFRAVITAFLKATLLAQPGARQNGMNAHTEVGYALGLYRAKGQPLQLVNAFEQPVSGKDGILRPSVHKLLLHHQRLTQFMGIVPEVQTATGTLQPQPDPGSTDELKPDQIPTHTNLEQFVNVLASQA